MAHFAKLDDDGLVLEVNVVSDETLDPSNEEGSGLVFLTEWSGGYTQWRQTSYNTHGGQHANGGTPFRYNYAGIGYTFSDAPEWAAQGGAFIPPQPFPSWTLNPDTALWDAPVPMPSEGGPWVWDEETLSWVEGTA